MRLENHLRVVLCAAAALSAASLLDAAPRIDHVGLKCIEPGTFAVVLSGIDPGTDIQTAKVYFRSALYPDFYYVEMTREDDGYVGILPQASPETPRVVYYVEAVDQSFESARSPEFDPPVEDPCRDRPAAAYHPGEAPGIVVGAVSAGVSALPPGFSAAGIVGTITAIGVSSGVGGGIGAGTAAAVAVGAAGGVVGAVAASQPEASSSTTTAASTTIRSTTTSSVAAGSPTTTVPTTTVPGPTTSTSTTTSVPSSPTSTTTAGPSTTSVPGSTTVPPSTTSVTVAPLNPDCFSVTVLGECRVRLDATCVNLPVDRYDWVLDTTDEFKKETVSNGSASFAFRWDEDDCEDDENITFFLEVRRGASRVSAQKTVRVPGDELRALGATGGRQRLRSELSLPPVDGPSHARVLLNGRLLGIVATGLPAVFDMEVPRENVLEGVVGRASGQPGTWRFELPGARELRVLEGNVLAVEPDAVVLSLSGTPGERLRFSFVVDR